MDKNKGLQFRDNDLEWIDKIRQQYKQETGKNISREKVISACFKAIKEEINSDGLSSILNKMLGKKR